MESQIRRLPAESVGGGLSKGRTASASISIREKAGPWPLPLDSCPDAEQFSCSPYSSVAFQVLLQRWSSEGVSLSKSGWALQKEMPGIPEISVFLSLIPTGFYSHKLRGLLFLAQEPWAGGLRVGLGPLALPGQL